MALLTCFCPLTNMFFSTLPSEYDRYYKEEIWGCFKHIGIPMETLMKMPIQDRKFYIYKHNTEQNELMNSSNNKNGSSDINKYAKESQNGRLK